MTILDPTGQMEIDRPAVGDHVFVRLPLLFARRLG